MKHKWCDLWEKKKEEEEEEEEEEMKKMRMSEEKELRNEMMIRVKDQQYAIMKDSSSISRLQCTSHVGGLENEKMQLVGSFLCPITQNVSFIFKKP